MRRLIFCLVLAGIALTGCMEDDGGGPTVLPANSIRVQYGSHALQNADIFLPEGRTSATKVVIMIHGGGWVNGYKPDADVTTFKGRYNWDIQNRLLDEGYACVVMKYRTACYNTVRANFNMNATYNQDRMMEDIDLVIDHMKAKSSEYEIGDNHFQLIGESAGGHLALTYSVRQDADEDLKSVISMFGPVTLNDQSWKQFLSNLPNINVPPPNYFLRTSNNCESVTNQSVQTFWSLKSFADDPDIKVNENSASLDLLSPHLPSNILKSTPTFMVHGDEDILVPPSHSTAMEAALINKYNIMSSPANDFSGVLKKNIYPNCDHGFAGGNCNREQVMLDMVSWIKAH